MKERKLESMPYAQAVVREMANGDLFLRSYNTIVASVMNRVLYCHGLWSATTRRHLGAFAKELGTTYQVMKQLYEDNVGMNLDTGEIIPA